MKKTLILGMILLILLLAPPAMATSAYSVVPWVEQTPGIEWPERSYHTSLELPDGRIILIDGLNEKVYSSSDIGKSWDLQTQNPGWGQRDLYTSIVLPDGHIILMGGVDNDGDPLHDVWRSVDDGVTWTSLTAGAPWEPRYDHTSVAMPDGSIILMGGEDSDGGFLNDVWRSVDDGETWTLRTADAGWTPRYGHACVVMPEGQLLLMGGKDSGGDVLNDVWRSVDNGANWVQLDDAGWTPRYHHASVSISAGPSVIVMGGIDSDGVVLNDVWISNYYGEGWDLQTQHAEWEPRYNHTSITLRVGVPMHEGHLFLMGGVNSLFYNDIWYSEDYGKTWEQKIPAKGWMIREGHSSVVKEPDGDIILMGGREQHGVYRDDVWRSTDYGETWIRQTQDAAWSARSHHSSVLMSDGSIILMGGYDDTRRNDVWRSRDNGATWTQQTPYAPWGARNHHVSVTMPDDSIVLMGGLVGGNRQNDVWRSTDYGVTWEPQTHDAAWSPRYMHSGVALPDGRIILMGGYDDTRRNDVWISEDYGETWQKQPQNGDIWEPRSEHTSVAMPDGSIILMGGRDLHGICKSDVWRSTDYGETWNLEIEDSDWNPRYGHTSVAMPDSSVVLMGGYDRESYMNDVWRLEPSGALFRANPTRGEAPLRVYFTDLSTGNPTSYAWSFGDGTGSSSKNPVKTYPYPGIYDVTLEIEGTGSTTETKIGYIIVGEPAPVAAFTASPTTGPAPLMVQFTDESTNNPTSWTWEYNTGGGWTEFSTAPAPLYQFNSPGTYSIRLSVENDEGSATDTKTDYIKVDSSSSGESYGVFRSGTWFIYSEDNSEGYTATVFGVGTDTPVVVDGGIGVFRGGTWYIKDDTDPKGYRVAEFGVGTDTPVVVDGEIGVYRGGTWYIRDDTDPRGYRVAEFGVGSDTPVVVDGKIGVFRGGTWFIMDETDPRGYRVAEFGVGTDTPVVVDGRIGVFRGGTWYITNEDDPRGFRNFIFGTAGDIPISSKFIL